MYTLIIMWHSAVGVAINSVPGFDSFEAAQQAGRVLRDPIGTTTFKVVKMSIQ